MSDLHVNHEFLLTYAEFTEGNVLDFGCGGGETVKAGLQRGIQMWGFDTYREGHSERRTLLEQGLLDKRRVRHSEDGHIPFEDGFFSLVVSNQVFEHVHDLELALSEISRVLMAGGLVVALFPTREVFREGHIGIPMSHWWPAKSRARALWVQGGRRLGLGYNKEGKTVRGWSTEATDYLNDWTVYRSLGEFRVASAVHFSMFSNESGYIRFRLSMTRGRALEPTTRWPLVGRIQSWALTKLFGRVVILKKKQAIMVPDGLS